jgi:type I restriction enzyme, S subunit
MQKTHQLTAYCRPLMGCCISINNLPYEKIGKNEPVCIADEVPFEIPDSWEWVRLKELVQKEIKRGKSPTYIDHSSVMVFAQKCNVKTGGIDMSLAKYLDEKAFSKYSFDEYMQDNDIVINSTGNGTLGRIGIFHDTDRVNDCIIVPDSHVTIVRTISFVLPEYIYQVLSYYQPYLEKNCSGSTNQTELKPAVIAELFIPVPPVAEQIRITNKLAEAFPVIKIYGDKEKALSTYNRTFPDQLKKSILQYAVQGKLVPQDPNDEPASVLLERIRAEKEQLIKTGKIKRDKHESVIVRRDNSYYEKIDGIERCIDDEIPFDVPDNWTWCRFGTALINRDCERIPLSVDERAKLEKIYDYYGASGVIDKVDRFLFNKPLLLIGEDGANLLTRSKPIAFIASGLYWVNNHAHVLDSTAGLSLEYVSIYINAINLAPYVSGTAQPKINQKNMNSILLAIPPVAEQCRIVAKINEILPALTTL